MRLRIRGDKLRLQDRRRPGAQIGELVFEQVTATRARAYLRPYKERLGDLWWDCPAF